MKNNQLTAEDIEAINNCKENILFIVIRNCEFLGPDMRIALWA